MRSGVVKVACAALAVALLSVGCASGRSASTDEAETPETAAEPSSEMFGSVASPCGTGDASGATAQGVTDDSIRIGYGDDAGFQGSPGLNHELSDAVKAMIEWCNEQGGINGRTVQGTYYDARITEANNAVLEACGSEFFLVGEGYALDSSQEQTRRGCGLPAVPSYAVSPLFANGPLQWAPNPVPADYIQVAGASLLAEQYPEEIKRTATMYADFPATKDPRDKVLEVWPTLGYEFLDCDQQYDLGGAADYKPFAQRLKDCGVEFVYYAGAHFPGFANLLDAANQLDYHPIWYIDSINEQFAEWNVNGYADDVYTGTSVSLLFEEQDNPGTQAYLNVLSTYGGDASPLGAQAASAFLLWATAASACGSDLTRECVAEQLSSIHEWTGGGIHAESDPGANLPSGCGTLVKVEGTSYVRVQPTEAGTFACDPAYAAPVSGPVVEKVNLDADRIAQGS